MGLPLYRDPDEDSATGAATKLDRAAASRRSPIRREQTIRLNRSYNAEQSRRHTWRLPDALRSSRSAGPGLLHRHSSDRDVDLRTYEQYARGIRQEARQLHDASLQQYQRRMRQDARQLHDASVRLTEMGNTVVVTESPSVESRIGNLRHREESRSTARLNRLLHNRQELERIGREVGRMQTASNPPTRPSAESSLRFELAPSPPTTNLEGDTQEVNAPPRNYRMPSPIYIQEGEHPALPVQPDASVSAIEDGPALLTPDFAPARSTQHAFARRRFLMPSAESWDSTMEQEIDREMERAELQARQEQISSGVELRPIIPMLWEFGPPPHSNHDGLGDRRRSPSADRTNSESAEEETWDQLLTTVNQYERQNTAPSSFASIASDSLASSNRSSQTAATSFGEIGQSDDTCDLDLPPGITEDDVREVRALHRSTLNRPSGRADYERMRRDRAARQLTDVRHTTVELESELAYMQGFIESMVRRDDIPDEWWAAAGLSRTIRDTQ